MKVTVSNWMVKKAVCFTVIWYFKDLYFINHFAFIKPTWNINKIVNSLHLGFFFVLFCLTKSFCDQKLFCFFNHCITVHKPKSEDKGILHISDLPVFIIRKFFFVGTWKGRTQEMCPKLGITEKSTTSSFTFYLLNILWYLCISKFHCHSPGNKQEILCQTHTSKKRD